MIEGLTQGVRALDIFFGAYEDTFWVAAVGYKEDNTEVILKYRFLMIDYYEGKPGVLNIAQTK